MTNGLQLLGKDLGNAGVKFIAAAGKAAYDDLSDTDRAIVDELLKGVTLVDSAIQAATAGTQTLTRKQMEGILGMVPEKIRLSYAGLVMQRADADGVAVTAERLNELANAPESAPAKPFRGLYPSVPDEVPAPNPPVGHKVHMECGPVEYRVSTLVLSEFQIEANRLGADGWCMVGQSLTQSGGAPQAITATFMRALESATSRRDDEGLREIEETGDAEFDQRRAESQAAGTQSSGGSGRDDRRSLPVVG